MATVTRHISATPAGIFDVLADGWLYATWVVGASQIRNVDLGWPEIGSRIHHSVGAWPLLVRDETEVRDIIRAQRLVLTTKARPFGVAEVTINLSAAAGGTDVTMVENPTGGPGRWVHNPVNDLILKVRNVESLDRLAAIAENRVRQTG